MNHSRDVFNKQRDYGYKFWHGQKDRSAEKDAAYFVIHLAVHHQYSDHEAQNYVRRCDAPVDPWGGGAFKNGSEGLVGVKVYGENHTQSKEYAKDHYICMYA